MTATQTLRLTYEQALAGLEQAVKDRGGDWVYPESARFPTPEGQCVNFDAEGKPMCIAGYVYSLHGIKPESHDSMWAQSGVEQLRSTGRLILDDLASELLVTAQARQDAGCAWGEAVRDAKQAVLEIEEDRRI